MARHGADVAYGFRNPGKSNGTDDMRAACREYVIHGYVFERSETGGAWVAI